MPKFNPSIFRPYDIRGVWREDFDAQFAEQLGYRVARALGAGSLIVGRDLRGSSDELADAVIEGAKAAGAHMIDIGRVSSPQSYWGIRDTRAVGGIMVTASHNPGDYNGFKVIARREHNLEVLGGHYLRQIYDSTAHSNVAQRGASEQRDIIPGYAADVAQYAQWSSSGEISASLDGPDPVLRALSLIGSLTPNPDLGIQFDSDGDRITFFDQGEMIAPDWMFLLLAERLRREPLVFDLRFSRAVRERLDGRGIEYMVSAVGRPSMTRGMQELGAGLGGETSGHYYWKEFGCMESPELTLLHVLNLLAQADMSLGELVRPYVKYHKSDELLFPVRDRKEAQAVIAHLARRYSDTRQSARDGLTADYWDVGGWWFNIRASNTESLLKLVIEAKQKDLLQEKISELQGHLAHLR